MNPTFMRSAWLVLVLGVSVQSSGAQAAGSRPGWKLTWHDEFNRPGIHSPAPGHWTQEIGGHGWGNGESEYYTARRENAREQNGVLAIRALKEDYVGADRVKANYTSARLKSKDKFSQRYGRLEARIKLPYGKGIWPAFWLLGDDISKVGWPACGEIDIMESIGEPDKAYGTIHGPGYSGKDGVQGKFLLGGGRRFQDSFHLFAVEWEPEVIRFYVDDFMYKATTPKDIPPNAKWVFDHPFFVVVNLAVGGYWPGNPDDSTVFPQTMQVDYIRVYSRQIEAGTQPPNPSNGEKK